MRCPIPPRPGYVVVFVPTDYWDACEYCGNGVSDYLVKHATRFRLRCGRSWPGLWFEAEPETARALLANCPQLPGVKGPRVVRRPVRKKGEEELARRAGNL